MESPDAERPGPHDPAVQSVRSTDLLGRQRTSRRRGDDALADFLDGRERALGGRWTSRDADVAARQLVAELGETGARRFVVALLAAVAKAVAG